MRRVVPLLGVWLLLAGCGGGKTVLPTAQEVVGKMPTTTQPASPAGNPKAGAGLFKSKGCGGCHTFNPAGSKATIGPDLDKLAQYAKQANDGPLTEFARESIANPGSYLQPGYQNVMPNFGQTLSAKQISDLVAYLTQKG
jgi:mono/diheme cytochrome c family protein